MNEKASQNSLKKNYLSLNDMLCNVTSKQQETHFALTRSRKRALKLHSMPRRTTTFRSVFIYAVHVYRPAKKTDLAVDLRIVKINNCKAFFVKNYDEFAWCK